MKEKKKLRIAVLILCLVLSMCCVVFAARGTTVSAMELTENMARTGVEIEYYDDLEAGNRLRDTVFIVGAGCVIVGAAGVVCMLLWRRAELRRDRVQEDREGILNEIEQAEIRNRQFENRPQKKAEEVKTENSAIRAAVSFSDDPIIPSTPVSMQPNERVRPRVQGDRVQSSTQPITVMPARASVPGEEKTAEPQPKTEKKYDLDEILKEIREGTL